MNLRLTDEQSEALRIEAEQERRSMQEVARAAVAQYVSLNDPRAGCGSTAGLRHSAANRTGRSFRTAR
jgi:predicted transcriptional regulator